MKYEVILKVKTHQGSSFKEKYRTICRGDYVTAADRMVEYAAHHELRFYDYVVLVNELSDEGDFIRSIL